MCGEERDHCERRIGRGARIIGGVCLWHMVGVGEGGICKANCMGLYGVHRERVCV